uniref:Uncharacterized protein n=1 Tax=Oryza rufipogon TaxID=4529 RepID=A0A0E0P604_ORYRU
MNSSARKRKRKRRERIREKGRANLPNGLELSSSPPSLPTPPPPSPCALAAGLPISSLITRSPTCRSRARLSVHEYSEVRPQRQGAQRDQLSKHLRGISGCSGSVLGAIRTQRGVAKRFAHSKTRTGSALEQILLEMNKEREELLILLIPFFLNTSPDPLSSNPRFVDDEDGLMASSVNNDEDGASMSYGDSGFKQR